MASERDIRAEFLANPQRLLRLAIEAVVSEKTVRRWLADPKGGVSARSRIRLEQACDSLGYEMPSERLDDD